MKWIQDEINYLKNNLDKSSNDLSLALKRNRKSILRKLKSLGLISEYKMKNNFNGKYEDIKKEEIRRKKISETCKSNKKSGGLRKGCGRGKKGTYKGYWCDSSYELAWVIYHIENDIDFERNNEKFIYFYRDIEEKNYIPDFKIDDVFYELKGYQNDTVQYKIKYFPFNLKILFEKDLKYIFDYVISKYGKNFISLYEDKKYKSCKNCYGYVCKSNKSLICKNCLKQNSKNLKNKSKNKNRNKNNICECGQQIQSRSKTCRNCSNLKQRKVLNRPIVEELFKEIDQLGYSAVGRKYGVSDNCIRKWIKKGSVPNVGKGEGLLNP